MSAAAGHSHWSRPASLLAGLFFIAAFPAIADAPRAAAPPRSIVVRATPIESFDNRDTSRRQFGALEFRGGLQLTSSDKQFGGISAIHVAGDGGAFIALSDKGQWLRGRIVYQAGRPAGIANAEMAPILGADGFPLAARGWFDTESIAADGGTLYVGIERVNEIVRFDYGRDGLLARGQRIALPPEIKTLPYNRGLEALVFVPRGSPLAGTLIAISERGLDSAGNIRGFLIGGPRPGDFTIKRSGDYDISDAALLPGGDLLVLERHYSIARGVAMRLRRIAQNSVRPGMLLDGPVLVEADLGFQIDNMEGLAVHRTAQGEVVLTLVSDDNFSAIQRTILLQFTLLEP